MADARPCSSGDRAPDSGSGCRPFESGQGHFGAVAQWQGVPSATGRSRVRIPPAPRHAACRRVEAQTFRGTTSCQDGAPPRWNTQTAASRRPRARRRGRPARERAGPISRGSWDRIPSPATRMWCSGSTPASQAGDRGFESRHPLYPGALVFDVFHPPIPCRGPRRRTDARRGPPIRAVRPFSSAVRTADF